MNPLARLKLLGYRLSTTLGRTYYRRLWGMQIGKGTRIARSAKLDKTNPRGVVIGDYTALSFDVAVLTHDFVNRRHLTTRIGSYCLIGARSVILAGVTIGDHSIVAAGSIVTEDVPAYSVVAGNPARVVERGITTGKWGIREQSFVAACGDRKLEAQVHRAVKADRVDGQNARMRGDLAFLLALEEAERRKPLRDIGLDSFAVISLRAEIETARGITISDQIWMEVRSAEDILAIARGPAPVASIVRTGATKLRREVEIGMPQMAVGGLSESWLLKELGDLHWQMLTSSLGVSSRDICDAAGERLYATFTCIKLDLYKPLAAFLENEKVAFELQCSRYGAGMFFSDVDFSGSRAQIMSSFSKFGEEGSNTSLVKGQPVLPQHFAIPGLSEAPTIVADYREARGADVAEIMFETRYDIVPYHDINGVGLLYFAAYPLIHDICASRYFGTEAPYIFSTLQREIFYFANSGPDDQLIFRIHRVEGGVQQRILVASLSRSSDGKMMALLRTVQASRDWTAQVRQGQMFSPGM